MNLEEYIKRAKALQGCVRGSFGWISAANSLHIETATDIANLMLQADEELTRLRAENERLRAVHKLASELCDAVDALEFAVGGQRPMKLILAELGPAVEAARSKS